MTCLPMAQALVLVPSTGNLYIYAASKIVMRYFDYVLVPSTGNLYIYTNTGKFEHLQAFVLVPSTGNLYIYNFQYTPHKP